MASSGINHLVLESLPTAEAKYQLAHINESKVGDIVATLIVCLVIAVFAIMLRFVSRLMNKARLKADDWMVVVALLFTLGYIISTSLCILKYGGGRHAILLKDPVKFAKVCTPTLGFEAYANSGANYSCRHRAS